MFKKYCFQLVFWGPLVHQDEKPSLLFVLVVILLFWVAGGGCGWSLCERPLPSSKITPQNKITYKNEWILNMLTTKNKKNTNEWFLEKDIQSRKIHNERETW